MSRLKNKNIVLGVTGSIAVYKACELVRLLVTEGAKVNVVMTKHATEFVTPLTFQALSQNPVRSDLFSLPEESLMNHIELADKADLILIAPASANVIAKTALGLSDDLLSTLLLATKAPIVMAPAMNVNMWTHPATVTHVETLKKRNITFIGPESGDLACGWQGLGRLTDPTLIAQKIGALLS